MQTCHFSSLVRNSDFWDLVLRIKVFRETDFCLFSFIELNLVIQIHWPQKACFRCPEAWNQSQLSLLRRAYNPFQPATSDVFLRRSGLKSYVWLLALTVLVPSRKEEKSFWKGPKMFYYQYINSFCIFSFVWV